MQPIREEYHHIASRALSAIGTAFRLHGRSLKQGLDCVGLVAHAIAPLIKNQNIPQNYRLRFDDSAAVDVFFAATDFVKMKQNIGYVTGDIILVQPAPQQLHFIINLGDSYVHAHSGLRRIVAAKHPILSPVIAVWRYKGE